jgi:FKBP-type peptidyl-prolyl cis-trans isomerase
LFAVLAVTAQEDMAEQRTDTAEPVETTRAAASTDAAATADDGFDNAVDRLSYAIGMDIGSSFSTQDIQINPDVLAEGLGSAYAGEELRLSEEQAMAAIQQFQQEMQAKQMQEMMKAQEEAVAENTEAAETFFAENKDKAGVKETESGLQYMISEKGEGEMPGPNDQVTVHYKGTLLDGTVFDSSYDRGEPATFGIDQVIPGFGEGLQLMPVGSKGKLFIPGDQAYGMQGGPGGPNAALIFDVEVLDTQGPGEEADPDTATEVEAGADAAEAAEPRPLGD